MSTHGNEPFLLANAERFIGRELALSDWLEIGQERVDEFGRATYWDVWMHCDPERCARESPYGGTLLHGFHAIALVTKFLRMSGVDPADGAYSLNYGTDKSRVLQPVVVGAGVRLRDRISLLEVTRRDETRVLLKTGHEIECEGMDGPVAFVEYLNMWHAK